MAARISALSADELASLPRKKPEAHALKSKYYFTGKPCKRGHLDRRDTISGKCCACAVAQSAGYYRGHAAIVNERSREWAKNNLEKRRIYNGNCRGKNPTLYRQTNNTWRKNNPSRVRTYKAASHKRNYKPKRAPDYRPKNYGITPAEMTRQWREADPTRAKNSRNSSAKRHPETTRRLRHIRRGRLKGAKGSFTSHDLKEIMKMQKRKCAYCRARFGDKCKPTLDHIIAIASGGSNYKQNLQFLCSTCNSSKSDRDPIDFARRKGLLL